MSSSSSSSSFTELDAFLASDEADYGMTAHARQLFAEILCNEDDPFKYFVNILLNPPTTTTTKGESEEKEESAATDNIDLLKMKQHAAISYRAMNMLKQDLSTSSNTAASTMAGMPPGMVTAQPPSSSILIKNPSHAGLLAKDLLLGLSLSSSSDNNNTMTATSGGVSSATTSTNHSNNNNKYTTYHIRELLDTLLESYPEKVMSAASAGGKQGIIDHLKPLMHSDQTLSILTHLVCYGCTGRKGIASAEKSAQHTANMYHPMMMGNQSGPKISIGQRKKFVKAIADFQLMDQLASELVSNNGSNTNEEEICESILTILEVIGYPPVEQQQQQQQQQQSITSSDKQSEINVGEDVLLLPLTKPEWWKVLLDGIASSSSIERKESIARTCNQAFALATGTSSRIVKSHAPATDATDPQTSEKIVEEKEETITNKLVEYGLTTKVHSALMTQIPVLVQQLQLPQSNILNYQATTTITTTDDEKKSDNDDNDPDESSEVVPIIRHPGRYQTVPLGSWRLQLLSLLKEIVSYRGSNSEKTNNDSGTGGSNIMAMDEIMKLPIPPELEANKKKHKKGKCPCCEEGESKKEEEGGGGGSSTAATEEGESSLPPFNPWPALCSFLWAYPNNDFYHHIFFDMLQAVVLQHHEPTLRLILQKSKFLTKAVRSIQESGSHPLRGTLLNCLNLLRLRSVSLPPKAFLHQYLGSHDGWKDNLDRLMKLTISQQTPIKNDNLDVVNIDLGSTYASNLGLAGITEWSQEQAAAAEAEAAEAATKSQQDDNNDGDHHQGKKKKKKKKKKK